MLLNAPLSSANSAELNVRCRCGYEYCFRGTTHSLPDIILFKFHSDFSRVIKTSRESSWHHSIIQYFQATHRYMQTALLPLHRFKVTNPRVLPQITYFYVHIGPKITNLVQPLGHSPDPEVQRPLEDLLRP